ncbi:hypothetical protein [Streptomyces broussonetiae]|uniref:hypothetical protein n=1 Tax=Streptomyces broussonetiae TaxID=2686304 RepID=UPI0035D9FCA9
MDARERARKSVERYWIERHVDLWGPGRRPERLGLLLAFHRILWWLLSCPHRRAE